MSVDESRSFVSARCVRCGLGALVALARWLRFWRTCNVCGGQLVYERMAEPTDFRASTTGIAVTIDGVSLP